MAALDASLVLDLRAGLLEGPVWDPNGALYFVDIMRGRVPPSSQSWSKASRAAFTASSTQVA